MKFRILALLTGVAAVALAIFLLLYFDPFSGYFDTVFRPGAPQPLSDVSVECVWRSSEGLESYAEPVSMIERYFDCFYSAAGQRDFDGERIMEGFFADSTEDCVYDLAAMKSGAARLAGSGIDLSYDSILIHLWVENVVEINRDGVIIMLTQSAEPRYNVLYNKSSGDGIYLHTFIFERYSGSWMITTHNCDGGAWGYARQAMRLLCGNEHPAYGELYGNYPLFCSGVAANVKGIAALIAAEGYGPFPSAEIKYNRDAALEYARRWTSVNTEMRNTGAWVDYERDSGNFVSQCIYAGVERMDTQGNYIWKWFDVKVDYFHEDSGCSMSWTEGENFWLYCTGNDRVGLCTVTDVAGGQLEIGDVIQLMLGNSVMSQVIVTDVVTDISGKTVELLVSGHDSELVDYPLSALHCDRVRMIKVIGYNNG